MPKRDVAVVIPAAGIGQRMGTRVHKPMLAVGGRPILFHTLERFQGIPAIREIILALHPDDLEPISRRYGKRLRELGVTAWVEGGARRQDSVERGLAAASSRCALVAVHDAVRPFVPTEVIAAVIEKARACGAALAAVPAVDTLKQVDGARRVDRTVPRETIWMAQTPQVFRREVLEAGFAAALRLGAAVTDDAHLVELSGHPVEVVPGSYENLKITNPSDLEFAEVLLRRLRLRLRLRANSRKFTPAARVDRRRPAGPADVREKSC
ncbi:MAG: 2-C-methyl-D-erythritol 4-phosphate cytidylyltransferase [Planctomycetes bacterium]|nr:2-C-methyl-D-erythritol 4-phosphate cytidylyltransferase [Planctomycetota bacterium]